MTGGGKVDTVALLSSVNIADVLLSYNVNLVKRGHEYIAKCINPSHADETPSMCVIPLKQRVHCFSCGYDEDAIGVAVTLNGGMSRNPTPTEFANACKSLGALPTVTMGTVQPEAKLKPAVRTTTTPPDGVMPPNMNIKGIGEPTHIATYLDADGRIVGYIARYNEVDSATGEVKKTFRPWTYGRKSENVPAEWSQGQFSAPRPLYGAELLSQYPDKPACIVEGERTADAARVLLPNYVCVTWPGGAMATRSADWSALVGRRVVIFPDADFPGARAAEDIAKTLVSLGSSPDLVSVIDSSGQPEGWDLADALADGWTTDQVIAWARENKNTASIRRSPGSKMRLAPPLPTIEIIEAPEPIGNVIPIKRRDVELAPWLPPEFSESALADAWSESHGRDWRFTSKLGLWFFWDGVRWLPDESKTVVHATKRKMIEVANWPSAQSLSAGSRRALCSLRTISSVVNVAGSDPRHATSPTEWDSDMYLLGTPDGVVDLRTGLIRESNRNDKITRITSVTPKAGLTPVWDKVLHRATSGRADVLDYIHRWCGYLLTGDTREEAFLFIHGQGGSGKSKFINTIQDIIGGYAKSASMDAFTERRNPAHAEEIARLAGARMVCATETEEGSKWNESRIKTLTGREVIAARHLYQSTFEFSPQFKIVIGGNHHPHLKSVGEEMRRRIHLLEFPGSIPVSERILDLPEKLKIEYPAILSWMIQGALAWQQDGLVRPQSVLDDTDKYLDNEDALGSWIKDKCEVGSNMSCLARIAYASYSSDILASGEKAPPQKQFLAKLESKGFKRAKRGDSTFIYGLELKQVDDDSSGYGMYK